jgi:dTDP-glucose 4,6-dehydratase
LKAKQKAFVNPLRRDLDHIISHTRGLWEELRNQRIFITGGTGFFGCWLLESFLWANQKLNLNASVLVLTRDLETFKKKAPHLAGNPSISFHTGDVRSFDFPEGIFDYIIHAAASFNANANHDDPLEVFDTIVEGTRHTIEFGKHCRVKKFLLISSGAVYGRQNRTVPHIQENNYGFLDPTDRHSAYSEGKRAAELLTILNAGQYHFDAKIARCFTFIGPYQALDGHWAISDFIRDGLNGVPIIVKGDGTPYRSYLYAADLMIFLWTILFQGKSCLPYNVGSDSEINIRSLAELVCAVCKIKKEIVILKKPVAKHRFDRYVPSIKRAQEEFNLKQEIGLQDAITRTIKFIKLRRGMDDKYHNW